MNTKRFVNKLQSKVAISAVGPSALRGQGAGVLRTSQDFLARMRLERIPRSSAKEFRLWLNRQTNRLLRKLPVENRPWGAARKAINLFLRDALYNKYLCERYRLQRLEKWLEIPLDKAVGKGLEAGDGGNALPEWPGLKNLSPAASAAFQAFASKQARLERVARVHLDVFLWVDNR